MAGRDGVVRRPRAPSADGGGLDLAAAERPSSTSTSSVCSPSSGGGTAAGRCRSRSASATSSRGPAVGCSTVTVAGAAGVRGRRERLGDGADLADGHARRVERSTQSSAVRSREAALQRPISVSRCSTRAGIGGEALVGGEVLAAEDAAKRAEQAVVGGRDRDPAGGGLEVLVRHDVGVRVSEPSRLAAADECVLRHVDEPGEARCRAAAPRSGRPRRHAASPGSPSPRAGR